MLTLGWSNDSYFVSESDGEVEVCASVLEGGVGAPVPPLDVLVGVGTAESGVGKWCVCVCGGGGGVRQCWREVWVLLCLLWMCWWV